MPSRLRESPWRWGSLIAVPIVVVLIVALLLLPEAERGRAAGLPIIEIGGTGTADDGTAGTGAGGENAGGTSPPRVRRPTMATPPPPQARVRRPERTRAVEAATLPALQQGAPETSWCPAAARARTRPPPPPPCAPPWVPLRPTRMVAPTTPAATADRERPWDGERLGYRRHRRHQGPGRGQARTPGSPSTTGTPATGTPPTSGKGR